MKQLFEFWCSGGCGGYFRTKLRTNIDGDYVIVCPSCGHEHFRVVRKGQITGDRHGKDEKSGAERIVVPLSAYSNEPVVETARRQGEDAAAVEEEDRRWLLWGRFARDGVEVGKQRGLVQRIKDRVLGKANG